MHRAWLIIAALLVACDSALAIRQPLSAPGESAGQQQHQQQQTNPSAQGLPPVQPWQPWQQLQQQLAPKSSNSNTTSRNSNTTNSSKDGAASPLKPTEAFVAVANQERPPAFKQVQQELQQQQNPPTPEPFECGKPMMPCGSAIPDGKTCPKGAGWCQPGYFCGFEGSTTEPSRCLPLPKDCGTAGNPCCPSNTDSPHSGSMDDKLKRKPFCKDSSTCFFYAPEPGLNNGDLYAGNRGAYACTAVAPECGTGQGKPCCPYPQKGISTNPPLTRTGCADKLFCNYDIQPVRGITAVRPEYMRAAVPGTCEANAADCGQFGKSCCIFTSASATNIGCGARYNETGRRGYCVNPYDSNSSVGRAAPGRPGVGRALSQNIVIPGSGVSSGGGGGSGRQATYRELVCTPCPARSEDVADNPSKYWPC